MACQLDPELALVKSRPGEPDASRSWAASSLVPSLEEATAVQYEAGALVAVQLFPESALVYNRPAYCSVCIFLYCAASSLVPSLEEATDAQEAGGAPVAVQFTPELALVYNRPVPNELSF